MRFLSLLFIVLVSFAIASFAYTGTICDDSACSRNCENFSIRNGVCTTRSDLGLIVTCPTAASGATTQTVAATLFSTKSCGGTSINGTTSYTIPITTASSAVCAPIADAAGTIYGYAKGQNCATGAANLAAVASPVAALITALFAFLLARQ